MDKERIRQSFNLFLKMYFDSCREIYEELDNKELLTGRQFQYLRMIDKHTQMTMSELADRFNLSKPTITEMMKRFEDTGLVEKRRCEADKRVQYITLTEQGKILANTNILESKRAVEKILDKLSEEEVEQLVRLFEQFRGETR